MKYRYTLIIPHYNIPRLLERLLKSVPKRDDLQIIVVDDCTKKERSELKRIQNRYNWVEWYDTGENGGGGKARNVGLKKAKGDYVFFADADDFFSPELNDFLNNDFTDDLIIFKARGIYEGTNEYSPRGEELDGFINSYLVDPEKGELLLRYLFGEPWCKLVRRSIIENNCIRFDEILIHNDTLFSYLVGHYAKSIQVYSICLYNISDRPMSVSKAINLETLNIRTRVFARKNKFLRDNQIPIFDELLMTPLLIYVKKVQIIRIWGYIRILKCEKYPLWIILGKCFDRIIAYIRKRLLIKN